MLVYYGSFSFDIQKNNIIAKFLKIFDSNCYWTKSFHWIVKSLQKWKIWLRFFFQFCKTHSQKSLPSKDINVFISCPVSVFFQDSYSDWDSISDGSILKTRSALKLSASNHQPNHLKQHKRKDYSSHKSPVKSKHEPHPPQKRSGKSCNILI